MEEERKMIDAMHMIGMEREVRNGRYWSRAHEDWYGRIGGLMN